MLPSSPGLYVLLLHLSASQIIDVGRLGALDFPSGWYTYVGSARGPGGLQARVRRHQRRDKLLHWHIDHLRSRAPLIEVWTAVGRGGECAWADALAALPGATRPALGFGSSDCCCRAHLMHFPSRPLPQAFAAAVERRLTVEKLSGVDGAVESG